ncbi:MAG: Sec-independent protein translocase protein TatB [Steroidobacteraceae bacterium]
MFVDFPEVVIIFGVALVVLGPKKLPGAAAQIGKWVGRARGMARQFREQLEQEVNSVQNALDVNATQEASIKKPGNPASAGSPGTGSSGVGPPRAGSSETGATGTESSSMASPGDASLESSADMASSPEAEPPPYGIEATSYDPSSFHSPDMDWHPEYGEEAALAPYGDPTLIPRAPGAPGAPDTQLSFQLDGPPATAPGVPEPAPTQVHERR